VPDPDPFRLRVMKAVCDRLKTITVQNGYRHDLSDYTDTAGRENQLRVFRGRDLYGDNDPLPMVSVLEDFRSREDEEDDPEPKSAQVQRNLFTILIMGFVPNDQNNPLDPAYQLSADVIKCLSGAKVKYNILGLGNNLPSVDKMIIGSPVHRPADNDISSVAFFFLKVRLSLIEDQENPFA
jgi:hypothetical protein